MTTPDREKITWEEMDANRELLRRVEPKMAELERLMKSNTRLFHQLINLRNARIVEWRNP